MKRCLSLFAAFLVILAVFPLAKAGAAQPAEVAATLEQDGGEVRLLIEIQVTGPEPLAAFTVQIKYNGKAVLQKCQRKLDSGYGTLESAEAGGAVTLVFCDYTGGSRSLPVGKHTVAMLYFESDGPVTEKDFTVSARGFANRLAEKVPVSCLPVLKQGESSTGGTGSEGSASSWGNVPAGSSRPASSEAEVEIPSQAEGEPGTSSQPEWEPGHAPNEEEESLAPGFSSGQSSCQTPGPSSGDAAGLGGAPEESGGPVALPVQGRPTGWYFPVLLPALVILVCGLVLIGRKEKKKKPTQPQESDEKKE